MSPPVPDAAAVRALDVALRGQGPYPVFQPIVSVTDGIVVGYEALSRFGAVGPDRVFAEAHRRDVLGRLEARALEAALAHRSSLPPNTFLSVNADPLALLAPEVGDVLGSHRPLNGVVIELTEHRPVQVDGALRAILEWLRRAGARLAVDDAGSGYAGLKLVLDLWPDLLKIDRGLVAQVDAEPAKQAMIEMLGTFASRIDAWVLCEGVERSSELEVLANLGVPLVQGYHLARPGAPWPEVDPVARPELRPEPLAAAPSDSVARLVEVVPTVDDAMAKPHVLSRLAGLVATVDAHGGVRRLFDLDAPAADGVLEPMRVGWATRPAELAARIVTRPARRRFDPVAVHDRAGRFLGVVRVDRLLSELAANGSSRSGDADQRDGAGTWFDTLATSESDPVDIDSVA